MVFNPVITDHLFYLTVRLYTFSEMNGLYALNPATGELAWNVPFERDKMWPDNFVYDHGNIIWQTYMNGKDSYLITALNAETGTLTYTNNIARKNGTAEFGAQVAYDHHLYFGDNMNQMYSLNADTGTTDWVVPAGNVGKHEAIGSLTASKNYLFRSNISGIDVINRKTGEKFFIRTTLNTDSRALDQIWDETRQTLYVISNGQHESELVAVDIEQRLVEWKLPLLIPDQLVLADDTLYVHDVSNTSNTMYEVNAITGKVNWSIPFGGGFGDMLATSDMIFFSSYRGTTTAISRKSHEIIWTILEGGKISMDHNRLYIMGSTYEGESEGLKITAVALN